MHACNKAVHMQSGPCFPLQHLMRCTCKRLSSKGCAANMQETDAQDAANICTCTACTHLLRNCAGNRNTCIPTALQVHACHCPGMCSTQGQTLTCMRFRNASRMGACMERWLPTGRHPCIDPANALAAMCNVYIHACPMCACMRTCTHVRFS